MGSLKNILQHLEENEKEYNRMNINSRDRDINQGWIECTRFFFNNFYIEEKTIQEGDQHETKRNSK